MRCHAESPLVQLAAPISNENVLFYVLYVVEV